MLGHVVNSAFMLVDVFVSGHPLRIMHVVWSTLFVLMFQLFSVAYWAAGGTDRYEISLLEGRDSGSLTDFSHEICLLSANILR